MTDPIISVKNLNKTYSSGLSALKNINLDITNGEVFALLGPNGAGKTTLISIICGIVNPSSGSITAGGFDILSQYRNARKLIGLVPQELSTDAFETVWVTVSFSRGLYGCPRNDEYIEKILRSLSLWDKRHNKMMTLSGGMKRRVLIAKALAHEPKILFLDEPTAGVDVALRHDMWNLVKKLREDGATIILTTHYIEEAEEIADRVGIINKGEIMLVEEKSVLMSKLGKKQLILQLASPIRCLPSELEDLPITLKSETDLIYTYDTNSKQSGIAQVLQTLDRLNIEFTDLRTEQTSLEDIFVDLIKEEV